MQRNTFFALFCIVSVGMNAFVAGVPVAQRARPMRISRSLNGKTIPHTAAFELETFSKTKEGQGPRDYISDLIWYLLGLTVGAFLGVVDNNLKEIKVRINSGQTRLTQAMTGVDSATKEELRNIVENGLGEALAIVDDIIRKIGQVLPSITSESDVNAINMDPSDIIYMILGMSLGDFLSLIKNILERSDALFVSTINSLTQIAGRVSPTIAEMLTTTSTEMDRARGFIRPILTNINQVLPADLTARK